MLIAALGLSACTSPIETPSSTPTAALAASPSLRESPAQATGPAIPIVCGPLAADSCATAVAIAERTLPGSDRPVTSVRIEPPTALMTCPPSGGLPGSRVCDVMVSLVTAEGEVVVALVRSGDGWFPSNLIR
jgi:hypothetical protein